MHYLGGKRGRRTGNGVLWVRVLVGSARLRICRFSKLGPDQLYNPIFFLELADECVKP